MQRPERRPEPRRRVGGTHVQQLLTLLQRLLQLVELELQQAVGVSLPLQLLQDQDAAQDNWTRFYKSKQYFH